MAKSPKPPKPIDPTTVINAQANANRINRITPFGSQTYGTGPDGKPTFTTSLSPNMQGLVDKSMSVSQTPLKQLENPTGFGDLQNAYMQKVMGGGQGAQPPQKQSMQQLPQINSLAGQPVNPAWNTSLNDIYGSLKKV